MSANNLINVQKQHEIVHIRYYALSSRKSPLLNLTASPIAFPKNNSGRDVMSGSPSPIAQDQLDELMIDVRPINK